MKEREARYRATRARNKSPPEEYQTVKWKKVMREQMRRERKRWTWALQKELGDKTREREAMGDLELTKRLGTGTAWIESLRGEARGSATGTDDFTVPNKHKAKARALKRDR